MTTARKIWEQFCSTHQIMRDGVPLFASDENKFVETRGIGQTVKRRVLVRHPDMEHLTLNETDKLIEDWSQKAQQYDGLIYMMHRRTGDGCSVIPLYIGKAETIGRHGNLSANLCDLHKRKDKFAR